MAMTALNPLMKKEEEEIAVVKVVVTVV